MVINTNISADTGARLLAESSSMLSRSLARLSSGSKLGSPGDDAAGMAVSMRFDAQINRTAAAASNVGNAISFAQTQDGYLKGTSENPALDDNIFRWGLLGTALDGVGGRMGTARRATRDVDLI